MRREVLGGHGQARVAAVCFFGIQFDVVDIVIGTVSLMTTRFGPSDVSLERLRAMPESARGDPAIHESLR